MSSLSLTRRATHSHDKSYRACPLCSGPMRDAVRTVLSGGPVPDDVLRTLLNCANNSEDWMSLCNPGVIPACVRLLKQYRRESPILEGERGILCLKLASLGFQVALLTFQDNPLSFTTLSPLDPNLTLTDHILSIIRPQVQQSEERVNSTGVPQRLIMPWLTSEDANVLLEFLYKERFRFLADRSVHPENWDGFSILLYGIWGNMRGMGSNLNPGIVGPKLLDVACRFVSVASRNKNEDLLTVVLIYTMRNIAHMFGAEGLFPKINEITNPNLDTVTDSMNVIRCYVDRLSSGPPDLKLWFHLYEWAHGSVHPDMSDLMMAFFRVSYAGIWSIFDPAKGCYPTTPDRICDLVDFFGQLMTFTGIIMDESIMTRRNKDTLLEVVRQSDVFALISRIMFLRLTPNTMILTHRDKKNFGELFQGLCLQLPEFASTIKKNCRSNSQLLKKAYPDWLKVVYHLQGESYTIDQDQLALNQLSNFTRIWVVLGFATFDAQPRARGQVTACLYARCPYPVLAKMEFGCVACQAAAGGRCGCQKLLWAHHVRCDARMRSEAV